jgi:hypothetical protein
MSLSDGKGGKMEGCQGSPRRWRLVLPCSTEYEIRTCKDCGQAWIVIKGEGSKEILEELQEIE